jgi:hypothetical protein
MLMPETSMHKYDFLAPAKNNVRVSRKIASIKAIPIAQSVKGSAHGNFGAAIFLLVCFHHRRDRRGTGGR